MKFPALIFILGLSAVTAFQDVWKRERDKTTAEFTKGLKMTGPLRVAMGVPNAGELDKAEDELGKVLEKALDQILQKIKDVVDKGKDFHKEMTDKMAKVALDFFNEGNERQAIIDLIEKLLKRKEKETRSLKESWEELKQRLRDFFKEKYLELKEKYSAFFYWLEEAVKKGLDITKDRRQAVRNIAREIIKYSKEVSKEVAIEALEALKPHKEELGEVWDELRKKVMEILHRDN